MCRFQFQSVMSRFRASLQCCVSNSSLDEFCFVLRRQKNKYRKFLFVCISIMTIIVYITSVTFKKELHTQQGHIETVLKAKQLPYQLIDIAQDVSKKDEMRIKCGDETAVAPQIFNEDHYCGDYKIFQQAVEEDKVLSFLKVI